MWGFCGDSVPHSRAWSCKIAGARGTVFSIKSMTYKTTLWLRTRWSGVRISPGAPGFFLKIKDLQRDFKQLTNLRNLRLCNFCVHRAF